MTLPRTILVATDFSECAEEALAYAVQLAAPLDATIHLLHTVTIPTLGIPEMGMAYATMSIERVTQDAQVALDKLAERYRGKASMAPPRLEVGDARDVIDRVAATLGADLIVMGTHGRRGFKRVLLGSIAESVVRSAPCPVLTVRPRQVTGGAS